MDKQPELQKTEAPELVVEPSIGEGSWIGKKYQVLEQIGSGGIGVVLKARNVAMDKLVAIKKLHAHKLNEQTTLRFQREANALSKLRHENIIAIHDFDIDEESGSPYMVMDFVNGRTLSEMIQTHGALKIAESLAIFKQICEGIEYAHAHGILHRDLKPSNVIIEKFSSDKAVLKIVDFGIAKDIGEDRKQLTQTGEIFGSPLYMSPEQCEGKKVDERSDIYSLGCILFEMLTGVPPIDGSTPVLTIMNQITAPPLTLKEASLGIDFPLWLQQTLTKALEKSPEKRFQTVSEFLGAVRSQAVINRVASTEKKVADNSRWTVLAIAAVTCIVSVGLTLALLNRPAPRNYDAEKTAMMLEKAKKAALLDATVENANQQDDFTLRMKRDPREALKIDGYLYDNILEDLGKSSQTHDLTIEGDNITDKGLSYLSPLKLSRFIIHRANKITDKGFATICGITTLETLDWNRGVQFTDQAFSSIPKLQNLTHLRMTNSNLDDYAMRQIAKCKSLKSLILSDNRRITDESGPLVGTFEHLEELDLQATGVGQKTFNAIKHLPKLANVYFGYTKIHSLAPLAHKKINILGLEDTQLPPSELQTLKTLPDLTELNLSSNWWLNDEVLPSVSSLPVQRLNLSRTQISDDGLQSLFANRTLKWLRLTACKKLSARAVQSLREALPDCEVVTDEENKPI